MRKPLLPLALACAGLAAAASVASARTIYDTIPAPLPANLASVAYEATSTSELGDRVGFETGPRVLSNVTVTMSSWACESGHWSTGDCSTTPGATFSEPITLNLYAVGSGNEPGTLLASKTQTFDIPYRPSDDPNCPANTWQAADGTCNHGLATNVVFEMADAGVTLPDEVIVGVAYNTSHHGADPYGTSTSCYASSGGCGYDALNVALTDPAATLSAGSNPAPDDVYQNSTWGGAYCDGGTGGTGAFRLDAGCWTGYKPSVKVEATLGPAPQAKQDVIDALEAIPAGDKKDGDHISKAVEHLTKSLDAKLWDGASPDAKHGNKVFDEEKKAVDELGKVKEPDVSGAIDQLVEIDAEIAQAAIDAAGAGSGDPKEVDKANEEMGKAQEELGKGKPDHAIDHYKKAWEHALKALKKAGK